MVHKRGTWKNSRNSSGKIQKENELFVWRVTNQGIYKIKQHNRSDRENYRRVFNYHKQIPVDIIKTINQNIYTWIKI